MTFSLSMIAYASGIALQLHLQQRFDWHLMDSAVLSLNNSLFVVYILWGLKNLGKLLKGPLDDLLIKTTCFKNRLCKTVMDVVGSQSAA